MIFERTKSEGLAHYSYLIGSGSEALVIDPRRDCQVYIDLAQREGLKIKYVFETHRNEDYLIGSNELNCITGAEVYHGPGARWKYGNTLEDGQESTIGKLRFTAIHTPGHTDESMSYVLADPSASESALMVFTGDALFAGEVGRTDLLGPDEAPRMARNLYESLHQKILPLGDGTILLPAHGAGSVCGVSIADREQSSLGIEKKENRMLQFKTMEEFVRYKVSERPERPPYFSNMEKWNLEGPRILGNLPLPAPLTPEEFQGEMASGAVVVDTSSPTSFGAAHIKDSFSIWLEGLPVYAGWFLPYDKPLLLVLEHHHDLENAVRYLVRIGYDEITGFLKGGIESWYNASLPTEHMRVLTVQELKTKLDRGEDIVVLDARSDSEWESDHIDGSMHIYVGHILSRISEIPLEKPVAMFCSTGRRAGMGGSILLREGCREVYNVLGSMTAWKAAGYPVTKD